MKMLDPKKLIGAIIGMILIFVVLANMWSTFESNVSNLKTTLENSSNTLVSSSAPALLDLVPFLFIIGIILTILGAVWYHESK